MIKRLKNDTFEPRIEKTVMPSFTTEIENYELDKDDTVVKYEMNMIELPFFSRDDRVKPNIAKKYIFSENQYVQVVPGNQKRCGYKILQDFDEKIFYALMRLYRKNNSRRIVTTIYELLTMAEIMIGIKEYARAKESVFRLHDTSIECCNILYSADNKKRISDERNISILQSVRIINLEDMTLTDKEEFKDRIKDSLKEIVVVELSDFIEQNIINKGFLYYDAEKLLEIDNGTARKIYIMIEKWRGWKKSDIISRSCRFLASRIPMSWDSSNIPSTIRNLENAVNELKEKNLIGDFILNRAKPLKDSEITFFFEGATETARLIKIEKENQKLAKETGQENIQIIEQLNFDFSKTASAVLSPEEKLISLIHPKEQTEQIKDLIKRFLNEKGEAFVKSNIEYSLKNSKENFGMFLTLSLFQDFGQHLRLENENNAFKTWFNGLTIDEKDKMHAAYQKAYGNTKPFFSLSESEKNQWRNFIMDNYYRK